jgi:hypothetical protein
MPIEQEIKLKIKCDNPDCPGNTLDPESREGWLIVSAEVYAETQAGQFVYCSADCLSQHSALQVEALSSLSALPSA